MNLGLKITPENKNYLYNFNNYYTTQSFLTESLYKDKFPIYRQVVLFDTNIDSGELFIGKDCYIISAKYELFQDSDLIPLLFDIPKSINIINSIDLLYYYYNPVLKQSLLILNSNVSKNLQGLAIIQYLKNYTPPIEMIKTPTSNIYTIDFTNLEDIYDLITQIRSLDTYESDNLDDLIGFDVNSLNYYNFQDDPVNSFDLFEFKSKNIKKISLELYYTDIIDPSNIKVQLKNNLDNKIILDSTSNIFLGITKYNTDNYNAPIDINRIPEKINTYELDFTGWSSFLDEYPKISISSINNDTKNVYFKRIVLEYSNIDIIPTSVDVIIDFTLYDTPNDLHNYIRTLPIYITDRLQDVQFYGLIEKYKRWKYGLSQSSLNYLLSFTTTDLISITQEFYFASNETEFEILTSFDNKSYEENPLICVDINNINSYDPNKNITQSIDISTNRDNKLFSITKDLSDWSDYYKSTITFANYNGFIYNEYMYDGYWSKIILTYIH